MHSREAQSYHYRGVFLGTAYKTIHSILVGENGLLGLPGTLDPGRTAQHEPTESHQEKPGPGFLEISVQDFPPCHSLVLPDLSLL